MQLTELNEQVNALAIMRKVRDTHKEKIDVQKEEFEQSVKEQKEQLDGMSKDIERTQEIILQALKESGNTSWKTESATISRKSKMSYKLIDKEKVLAYLKKKKLTSEYTVIEFAPHITSLYDSVEVPGVERITKEYISVLVK